MRKSLLHENICVQIAHIVRIMFRRIRRKMEHRKEQQQLQQRYVAREDQVVMLRLLMMSLDQQKSMMLKQMGKKKQQMGKEGQGQGQEREMRWRRKKAVMIRHLYGDMVCFVVVCVCAMYVCGVKNNTRSAIILRGPMMAQSQTHRER